MIARTHALALFAFVALTAAPVRAQSASPGSAPTGTVSAVMDRAISRARALVDNGEGNDARAVLDSLVGASTGNDLGEALFWRGALAERVGESERDWKRLIIELPLAPRATDALVRLGELEMLRGRPSDARSYFARVVREYPNGASLARSQLWIAKSYVAQRDMPRACVTLAQASATGVPAGELQLQAEEMGRQCATVDRKLIAKAADELKGGVTATPALETPAKSAAPAKTGRFSVQLAAYDTRGEAEASAARFVARGIEARVDGEVKPFRVRAGYYETRAAANTALARLKRQGQDGFIAEIAK